MFEESATAINAPSIYTRCIECKFFSDIIFMYAIINIAVITNIDWKILNLIT